MGGGWVGGWLMRWLIHLPTHVYLSHTHPHTYMYLYTPTHISLSHAHPPTNPPTWSEAWIHTSITLVEARAACGSGAKGGCVPPPSAARAMSRRATPYSFCGGGGLGEWGGERMGVVLFSFVMCDAYCARVCCVKTNDDGGSARKTHYYPTPDPTPTREKRKGEQAPTPRHKYI